MNKAIEFIDVSKSFGATKALNNLNLNIEKGDFYGLLGPNGAGKSTLIGILGGLIIPDTGTTLVMDYNVRSEYIAARKSLGIVPQELVFDPFFTVYETLSFQLGYFGKKVDKKWILELLDSLGLANKMYSNMRTLSGGMKRRVLLAQALVHKPEVVVLDEPTAGVDVDLRRDMWRLVKDLQRDGVTIVLTTHYIEEAEEIADRIAVIHDGQILLIEDKNLLMKRLGKKQLLVELADPIERLPKLLEDLGIKLHNEGRGLTYTYDMEVEQTGIPEILGALKSEGIRFNDVRTEQSSLEEIFIELIADKTG